MTESAMASGLHPRFEGVALRDVALGCLMFDSLTSYNKSLVTLHKTTRGRLDLAKEEHRFALLKWLNEWGCRHLAKEQHEVASCSIVEWYEDKGWPLKALTAPLWQLEDRELAQAAAAYGNLKDKVGARPIRGGTKLTTRIGPTAASKVLFALRPEVFAPWDVAMRKAFDCDGSPESYKKFLSIVRNLALEIATQCENNGFPIERLPCELGRPKSTVVSLINEYLWVTISAGARLPHRFTLARWAIW